MMRKDISLKSGIVPGLFITVVLLVGGMLSLQFFGAARHSDLASKVHLAEFTENGVAVEITLSQDKPGHRSLTAVFTPTDKDFHLYSKDLPRNGIQGVGRPTLLEVVSAK